MILSLVLWACANKVDDPSTMTREVEHDPLSTDMKTGVMVSEMETEPVVSEVRIPEGRATVRECFGRSSSYRNRGGSSGVGMGPGSPTSGSARSSSAPSGGGGYAAAPPPSPPVVAQSTPSTAPMGASTADSSSIAGGNYAPMAAAEPAPAVPTTSAPAKVASRAENKPTEGKQGASTASKTTMARDQGGEGGAVAWGDADDERAAPAGRTGGKGDSSGATAKKKEANQPMPDAEEAEMAPADGLADLGYAESSEKARAVGKDGRYDKSADRPMTTTEARREAQKQQARRNLDWGATTYLSNDDSMSLASAQRLLWAIQNRGPVKTSEIRPHELLNYFSFDTAEVPRGDTFSVLASAEETSPGTMTMAFAVKGVTPPHTPMDLTLVLDRSGSMSAEGRMEYLKRGLTKMTSQLQRGDRVDVVLFDDRLCTPLEDFVVGRDDPSLLTDVISAMQPRGSTDLDSGLREGYRIANARADEDGRHKRMVLVSDALLNTGEVDEDVVSEIGKAYEKSGIRLSAVGVGRDFNDAVLDSLTEKGHGAYVYLGSEAVVDRVFGAGFQSLTQTVANDVHFALDLPDSLAIERFYGEESSTNKADVQAINYYAGTTQLFLQDLAMADGGAVYGDPVTLTVEWTDVDTGAPRKQHFRSTVGRLLKADNRNLHKGRALMAWTDLILARSLGNDPCGAPYDVWDERVGALGSDAEIAWLDGLTAPLCGERPASTRLVAQSGVPYKVKVDSDQVIAEVGMECGGKRRSVELSGNVARFDVAPGACSLVLYGNVPMIAQVDVPSTGGDVRCIVRGGKLSCS